MNQEESVPTPHHFLKGGGEMGKLTREFDWTQTALGAPDQWPQSLRTTVSIVLNSRFPMFMWWGPDLLQFYNDAYRPSLGLQGKHPTALGQAGELCWPEIWPIIKPLLDQVLAGGEATWSEDQLIPFYRNGQIEDIYWTFSYSPVYGEGGEVAGVLTVCQETTRQVNAQRQLTLSENRFRRLIEQAPVAVALFGGAEFEIILANDRVLEYWGRNREQVINKPLFEALPEASGQGFEELLTGVYTTGKPFAARELSVTLKRNGVLEPTYIDFVYEAFYELDGSISGVLVVCTEITEQVLARQKIEASEDRYRTLSRDLEEQVQFRTRELATLNEALSKANDQLTDSNTLLMSSNEHLQTFAYAASHDLQEPLRKIQQFSNLLKGRYTPANSEEKLYLNRMDAAASRMATLIDDLLSFSRLASQQGRRMAVSIDTVVQSVLSDLDVLIAETGAEVYVTPLPRVAGDPTQLGQLFQNLLTNAIKFRAEGTRPIIHISSSTMAADQLPPALHLAPIAAGYHRVEVRDNGIGFDEKYLDRIFRVFQRLHGRSEYEGTGVGLAICERVARNHGGAITARSQLGQGATFSVFLPRDEDEA